VDKAVNLPRLPVWCILSYRGVIGLFFLERIAAGDPYLHVFQGLLFLRFFSCI